MSEVFVVGALHWDVVVDAPHLPRLDETVTGSAVAYRFGGKGGNQAVAAARFGALAAMASRVGGDAFGENMLRVLDAAGVDRIQVRVADGASGMSVAITDANAGYGAVIVSGVNAGIVPHQIEVPRDTSVLLLQNEIPEAVNVAIAAKAPDQTLVILNAAPARPVDAALLDRVDILVVNRVEAAVLTGQNPDITDPEDALAALRRMGPGAVIVTLGSDGLIGAGPDGAVFRRRAHRVRAVSTHGAGDAFIGALAADLVRGAALERACDFAQAAAALVVATDPARRERLTRADVATSRGT